MAGGSSSVVSAPVNRYSAADAIVAQLEAAGVLAVFMLPGEENLALVDALAGSGIDTVVCRHEQHAAFMAVAHARLTGRPAVCASTLGPGALNMFTGLAQAQLIGVPVLALTAQKPLVDNTEGSFQVVDVVGAARPLVVHACSIADPELASVTVRDALRRAIEAGGAVLVEVPDDVAKAAVDRRRPTWVQPASPVAHVESLDRLGAVLDGADRPVLLVGANATAPDRCAALERTCELSGLSVITTQMAKGALPEHHPRSIGSLGMNRPDYVTGVLHLADVVVTVGYQPVEHPPSIWRSDGQLVAHLNDRPPRAEAGYEPGLEVIGDIAHSLEAVTHLCLDTGWADEAKAAVESLLAEDLAVIGEGDSVAAAVRVIGESIPEDAVVSLDNGLYKLWFGRIHPARSPRSLLLDNALATMGAGLAGGMEAARLGETAIVVTGDGGLLMNIGDLETAARLGLDLTIIVLRDDAYGFIEWRQNQQGRQPAAVELGNPDLGALAESFGARFVRAEGVGAIAAAVQGAASSPGLHLIDCPVDYSCNSLLERDDLPGRLVERIGQGR